MKRDDLKVGMYVKFTEGLIERYKNPATVAWNKGDIAMILERRTLVGGAVDFVIASVADSRVAVHGGGLRYWVERASMGSAPVEQGAGIAALKLPEPRAPYVCAVSDYDLLPDA